MMTGTTRLFPTYPTIPHMGSALQCDCYLMSQGELLMRNGPPGRWLVFQREAVFLDHRVGQYLAGDALDFGIRLLAAKACVEVDLEVLALAQIADAAITHLLQCAVNGFALRIEHTLL